jgi:hypothetical protein
MGDSLGFLATHDTRDADGATFGVDTHAMKTRRAVAVRTPELVLIYIELSAVGAFIVAAEPPRCSVRSGVGHLLRHRLLRGVRLSKH